jgi:beta-galactosidase
LARISRRSALALLGAPIGSPAFQPSQPARGRISLNGPWRWKPDESSIWGSLDVPDCWPTESNAKTAWYEREVAVPADWRGRRITLSADCINSVAVVYAGDVKAGEMRYPCGEIDLTPWCRPGATFLLRMRVTALPLQAVMLSYSDTASVKTIEGTVARRGITGDLFLESMPAGTRLGGIQVETSVRRGEITVAAEVAGAKPGARYGYFARVYEGGRLVKTFAGADPRFAESWLPPKLWDTHTPSNQYQLTVTLTDSAGRELDTSLPVRFGFRELWIDGRDFYLNGTRIYLSATPLNNAQTSVATAAYEATREALRNFKSIGVNFVYTHNYGCEPGTHFGFENVLRAADDEGMLVAFSQPHFGQYDWTAPDADASNGYAQHAAFYVRVAGNHPSVVFYSTSHNGAGYSQDMNPDLLDGIEEPREPWSARGAERARRAEAIIHRLDGSRIVYHHAGGNLNAMHTVNFYGNWIPSQEMDDWFAHWATAGVKPLFTCEYSVPFVWDWSMYRGWYKGKREFGSAVVPWEFHVAEWDAQFLGGRAYRIGDAEKVNLRWEAEQFRQGSNGWRRNDYPYGFGSPVFEDRLQILAAQFEQNWRAFRTWGLSANGAPWDIENYWPRNGKSTAVIDALRRCNMPLLAYIAGKGAAFTTKDHNFLAGEQVEKQLVLINNSRETVVTRYAWKIATASGGAEVNLRPGEQRRIPVRFEAPSPGRYDLRAVFTFGNGQMQEDSFPIDVMAPPPGPRPGPKVAVFNPAGSLNPLGTPVEAAGDLTGFDTLIVAKGALTLTGAAPDISRVREGLKVIVFEQSAEVLEKRFGFRVAEYGLRWVFPRIARHPLLAGIEEPHLRNWRGESTLLPPRLRFQPGPQFNLAPTVTWAGIPVTRVWRAGNRGTVASVLIEKPACGDFLPVLDGGYGLQYSPLLEYREGNGMVLFCQMDVSGRTEADPAAELLVRNILAYVSAWRPPARRKVRYFGRPEGAKYLETAGIAVSPESEAVVAFGLNQEQAGSLWPGVTIEMREHIGAHFDPFGLESPFAGVSPADLFNRDPRQAPLVIAGARVVGDGALAASEDGSRVFVAMGPWEFAYSAGRMNRKRTFRNFARLTARVFGNLGAEMWTPILERFSAPVGTNEQRWLQGLYMDSPEEWDDPYRFFRW